MQSLKTISYRRVVAAPLLVTMLVSLQVACSKKTAQTNEPVITYSYKPLQEEGKNAALNAAPNSDPSTDLKADLGTKIAHRSPAAATAATEPSKNTKSWKSGTSAKSTGQSARTYVVQIGAFSKKENAERLLKQLEEKKYPAFIKTLDHKSLGQLFLVRLQPTKDRSEAEKYLTQLKDTDKLQPTLLTPKSIE